MIYKSFQDVELSSLGMGNMRLPVNANGHIDEAAALEMIEYCFSQGINYFDTAYRYHGGESEPFVGKALAKYPRESFYLASKMPGHMMRYEDGKLGFVGYLEGLTVNSIDQIFEDQLKRCGVDYFDFYLLHNVCETSIDFYMNEELGVVDYLLAQKEAGRIRHFGFSAHGRAETIERFLNYRDCFEFCQIQLNYMDWSLQEAGKKYALLTDRGIPVVVMEPVRGGSLANLNPKAEALLKAARPNDSIVSWAFRFLQSLPNVVVVLSGMSNMEQLKENVARFANPDPTTPEEKALLDEVVATMVDMVPCTACRYCCEECPQNLDIPRLISLYNEANYSENLGLLSYTTDAMAPEELPGACIGCGICSQVCPQNIEIPEILKKLDQML